jgi:hypothetical protein
MALRANTGSNWTYKFIQVEADNPFSTPDKRRYRKSQLIFGRQRQAPQRRGAAACEHLLLAALPVAKRALDAPTPRKRPTICNFTDCCLRFPVTTGTAVWTASAPANEHVYLRSDKAHDFRLWPDVINKFHEVCESNIPLSSNEHLLRCPVLQDFPQFRTNFNHRNAGTCIQCYSVIPDGGCYYLAAVPTSFRSSCNIDHEAARSFVRLATRSTEQNQNRAQLCRARA